MDFVPNRAAKAAISMRYLVVHTDVSSPRPSIARRARRPSLLARIHWPRVIALAVALGLWPAIFFMISRFF
jgi:hypothetical protein